MVTPSLLVFAYRQVHRGALSNSLVLGAILSQVLRACYVVPEIKPGQQHEKQVPSFCAISSLPQHLKMKPSEFEFSGINWKVKLEFQCDTLQNSKLEFDEKAVRVSLQHTTAWFWRQRLKHCVMGILRLEGPLISD